MFSIGGIKQFGECYCHRFQIIAVLETSIIYLIANDVVKCSCSGRQSYVFDGKTVLKTYNNYLG